MLGRRRCEIAVSSDTVIHAQGLQLHRALLTIVVTNFFHELVHYIRLMTGSQPMPENRQQNGETNKEEEDTEGFDAEIEPFGLLENYIRVEGGESFEDLVALSFTPRDGHELYLPCKSSNYVQCDLAR